MKLRIKLTNLNDAYAHASCTAIAHELDATPLEKRRELGAVLREVADTAVANFLDEDGSGFIEIDTHNGKARVCTVEESLAMEVFGTHLRVDGGAPRGADKDEPDAVW